MSREPPGASQEFQRVESSLARGGGTGAGGRDDHEPGRSVGGEERVARGVGADAGHGEALPLSARLVLLDAVALRDARDAAARGPGTRVPWPGAV